MFYLHCSYIKVVEKKIKLEEFKSDQNTLPNKSENSESLKK